MMHTLYSYSVLCTLHACCEMLWSRAHGLDRNKCCGPGPMVWKEIQMLWSKAHSLEIDKCCMPGPMVWIETNVVVQGPWPGKKQMLWSRAHGLERNTNVEREKRNE